MTDLSHPFYTVASEYDVRRSGSGSITRPSYLGTPFPRVHQRPFRPGQHPTVETLMRRIYGAPLEPEAASRRRARATRHG